MFSCKLVKQDAGMLLKVQGWGRALVFLLVGQARVITAVIRVSCEITGIYIYSFFLCWYFLSMFILIPFFLQN